VTVTGSIFPIGNGGAGKTALALALSRIRDTGDFVDCTSEIKKTVNMEFEFSSCHCEEGDEVISMQLYVPPGQQENDQGGKLGTFDQVLETFSFMPNMQKISVILLVYKVNDFQTFADLQQWIEVAVLKKLIRPYTSFVLIGTHLDMKHLEVRPEQIKQGLKFVEDTVRTQVDTWQGHIDHTVVSNTTGVGLIELRRTLGEMICLANAIRKSSGEALVGACSDCLEKRMASNGATVTV
jgi:GTPase SAR1 family protein